MFGDPVRRGPIESIRRLAVSMTFESRNPSWRIALTISRSTRSSAGSSGGAAIEQRRTAAKTLRKRNLLRLLGQKKYHERVDSPPSTVDSGSTGEKRTWKGNDYRSPGNYRLWTINYRLPYRLSSTTNRVSAKFADESIHCSTARKPAAAPMA